MKQQKTFKIIITLFIISSLIISGCSAGKKSEEPQVDIDEAVSSEPTHINIYRPSFNIANPDADEVQKVENAVNDYIKDKINVEISLTDIGSSEYPDKANLALANKEINMLWTAYWLPSIGTNDLYLQKAVYNLTDLISGTPLFSSMPEWVWESAAYEGNTYFVSCYKEGGAGIDLMFRKDLVDQYNWDITSIQQLKDLEPMLEDAKNAGIKYPFLMQKTGLFWRFYVDKYDSILSDSLLGVDQETNTITALPWTTEYQEFSTLMCEWGEKGYVSEDEITKVTNDSTASGQDWAVSFWVNVPNNAEASARYGQDIALVQVTENWSSSNIMIGSCYCVTSYSSEDEAKACVDFLQLLYTDSQLADLWTYGIEGTDYIRNENNTISKTGDLYNHSAWESGSVLNISLEESEPENKIELYEQFNQNIKPSVALGFRFDKSNVEAQYSACLNLFEQYGYILECGGYPAKDVDAVLKEYQEALNAAGFQDILAEADKQYETWKNTINDEK